MRKTSRSRNILDPTARLRNRRYETIASPFRVAMYRAPSFPSQSAWRNRGPLWFSTFSQINTTCQGVGHWACSLRAIVQHLCHPRRAGRALPVGSANRMNPNAVGLDPDNYHSERAVPWQWLLSRRSRDAGRLLPGELLPREPRRPRRRLGAGHHGAAEGAVVRAEREAGHARLARFSCTPSSIPSWASSRPNPT